MGRFAVHQDSMGYRTISPGYRTTRSVGVPVGATVAALHVPGSLPSVHLSLVMAAPPQPLQPLHGCTCACASDIQYTPSFPSHPPHTVCLTGVAQAVHPTLLPHHPAARPREYCTVCWQSVAWAGAIASCKLSLMCNGTSMVLYFGIAYVQCVVQFVAQHCPSVMLTYSTIDVTSETVGFHRGDQAAGFRM